MSFMMRPPSKPANPEGGRPAGDELDGLLRAYFRAEMPDPWPAAPVPERANERLVLTLPPAREEAAPRHSSLFRSRLALALSVALLILGALLLGGRFTLEPTGDLDGANLRPSSAARLEYGGSRPGNGVKIESWLEQPPDGPTDLKIFVEPVPLEKMTVPQK
jgi:hypothetical protein